MPPKAIDPLLFGLLFSFFSENKKETKRKEREYKLSYKIT
jgi:hypothetical protein